MPLSQEQLRSKGPQPGAGGSVGAGRDEAALVAALQRGEAQAFEELVRTRGTAMLTVARRYFDDASEAEDAVQEAFLSAFKGIGKFGQDAKLATWLHRIVCNACLMRLRTRRRRPERSIEGLLPTFEEDGHQTKSSVAWKPPVGTGIESVEVRAVVRAAIEELPDQYREVIMLRDIEGLDTEAAAEVVGVSPNAVKIRLHRARQALRALLEPHMAKEQLP